MANAQIITIDKIDQDKPAIEQRLPAEEEIRRTREQIAATATQIQLQMRSNLSWRRWVDRHPVAVVTLAVTIGFLVGSALPSSNRPRAQNNSEAKASPQREQELIEGTGKNALVATVLTDVAMNVLREGSSYLVRRFFSDK